MNLKISIQIPTYNQKQFIKKTIESCLMQDYENIEINIADDNSTDDSYFLIEPFLKDKRVRYFKNERNIGRVANYRKALYEYATGDWAINLDGDDYFTDTFFISRAVKNINEANDDNVVLYQANQNLQKVKNVLPGYKNIDDATILVSGTNYFLNYYKILYFNHCATLYKRSAALQLNFYSFNCLFTDFNSMAKLFIKGNLLLSDQEVAYWNKHEANQSATINGDNIIHELASIDNIENFALESNLAIKDVKRWCKKMKRYFLYVYLDMQGTKKDHRIAFRHLLRNFNPDSVHAKQILKSLIRSVVSKKRL